MDAVTHTELRRNSGIPHGPVKAKAQVKDEVVVTAVHKPFYCLKLLQGFRSGFFHVFNGRIFRNGIGCCREFAALGDVCPHFPLFIVQPPAHGVAAGEHVGVALGVYHGAASAHGEAHDGPLALASAAVELGLHRREELLEEEVFVVPSGDIEIAVMVGVDIGVAGVWHEHHERPALAGSDEFVCNPVHPAQFLPGGVVVRESVEEHNQRIMLRRVISLRKVHVVVLVHSQNVAVDRVGFNFSLRKCAGGHKSGGNNGYQSFHTAKLHNFPHSVHVFGRFCGRAGKNAYLCGMLLSLLYVLISGIALPVGGIQMQYLWRNQLGDVYSLGLGSAACLGAAAATMSGWCSLTVGSFICTLICTLVCFFVTLKVNTQQLITFGILFGTFIGSLGTIVVTNAPNGDLLKQYYLWGAANFRLEGVTTGDIIFSLVLFGIGLGVALWQAGRLTRHFKEEIEIPGRDKAWLLLAIMCLVTSSVSICGPIGFISLGVPNLSRLICRSTDIRKHYLISSAMGVGLLLITYLVVQYVNFGIYLPISATMAILALPLMALIFVKSPGQNKS